MMPTQIHVATSDPRPTSATTARARLDSQLPVLRQRLLRHARYAMGDEGTAEDLVQDTLMAVVQQADTHRGDASLSSWAVAILKNKIADWYRSPARRRFAPLHDAASADAGDDAGFDDDGHYVESVPAWQQPENRAEQQQMMTVLENCVSCLPPRTGRVFMMREWLGFETSEVCERLSLSAENCRTMLHRARASLRSCMQQNWIGSNAAARSGSIPEHAA